MKSRRSSEGRLIVEVMETLLDCGRLQGAPEQPPNEPRDWLLFPRTVWVTNDGAREVLQNHVVHIEATNLSKAQEQLEEFLQGKVFSSDEW